MGDVFYIRPSTVQSYLLCPARTGLRGQEGFNYLPNETLLFGSVTHWLIEQIQERGGDVPRIDELLAAMQAVYVKDAPDELKDSKLTAVTTRAQRMTLADGALEASELWLSQVERNLPSDPHVEETLEMEIGIWGERPVVLRGTPDSVWPEVGLVADWKTAGRAWDAKKIEGQLQRIYYPMMATEHYDEAFIRFDYWVFNRDKSVWDQHKAPAPTEAEMHAAREMAMAVAGSMIETSWTFAPAGQAFHATRGWHCSPKYCDAWAVCPGKHLIRDGKANQRAITIKERWSE